eukprot:762323_1
MNPTSSNNYWICQDCDFKNNKYLKTCIFCTNKWKCLNCNFFNSIKNYYCTLCESNFDSDSFSSDCGHDCGHDSDHEFDKNEHIKTLPKYSIKVPTISIPSQNNKLPKKRSNKIKLNDIKNGNAQTKLWELLNSSY